MSAAEVPPSAGRFLTVDLETLTSADVRTLLAVVLEREAKELRERCARIARANEILDRPTIGAYRHGLSPAVQAHEIDL